MTDLNEYYQQLPSLIQTYMPSEAVVPVGVVVPAIMVLLGLGTAILGARLARPALMLAFTAAGAAGGALMGQRFGLPVIITMPTGALLFGAAGHFLHRLWVGALAGALLSLAVGGGYGFGMEGFWPKLQSYEELVATRTVDAAAVHPSLEAQAGSGDTVPTIQEWLAGARKHAVGFWRYATADNSALRRNIGLLGFTAGLFGMLIGFAAGRFTLIAGTAVIGTMMISSGVTVLTQTLNPDLFASAAQYPRAVAASCGLLLAASAVLQMMLTRTDKSAKKKKSAKS